jgi:hypothetical protein
MMCHLNQILNAIILIFYNDNSLVNYHNNQSGATVASEMMISIFFIPFL